MSETPEAADRTRALREDAEEAWEEVKHLRPFDGLGGQMDFFIRGYIAAAEPRDVEINELKGKLLIMETAREVGKDRVAEIEGNYQTALDEWNVTINSKRALENEAARLREALREYANPKNWAHCPDFTDEDTDGWWVGPQKARTIAQYALAATEPEPNGESS